MNVRATDRADNADRFDAGGTASGNQAATREPPAIRPVAPIVRLTPLPVPPTPLVGRERELATLQGLLIEADRPEGARLVTLTGPGGVGKTRFAIAAARQVADAFADGVAFVALAPLVDPDLVLPTIAQAVGVLEQGDRPLGERLATALRVRHMLLVLDNFERVVDAASPLAALLAACPRLTVLVTSRIRLRLAGERTFPLPPLALPEAGQAAGDVAQAEAVRLFVVRAQAADPAFALTEENAMAVATICRRLDGLPLAIELAAARSDSLPPAAILTRLERRLALLTGGPRDAPARLQTMRAAIAWSHDLLSAAEQALFRRLTVFAGGFTLEAAEYVGRGTEDGGRGETGVDLPPPSDFPPPSPVLDLVAALVEASLLRREEGPVAGGDEPRYAMLETVRDFGLEALAAEGEEPAIRARHAAAFLVLAERAEPNLRGKEGGAWLARLAADHDNLRAAMRWAAAGQPAIALRLGGALSRYWFTHGHMREGRDALHRALSAAGSGEAPPHHRVAAVFGFGYLSLHLGDLDQAEAAFEDALGLWHGLGNRALVARTLGNLGTLAEYRGDDERATARYEEALALHRELGDRYWVGLMLENLADAAYRRGEGDRAAALAGEALAVCREAGDDATVIFALVGAAQVACERADWAGAAAHLAEGLALAESIGFRLGVADALSGCAAVAAAAGRAAAAIRLLAAASAVREAIGSSRMPHHELFRRALAAARAALDEAGFLAAWEAGQALTPDEARAEAEVVLSAASRPAGALPTRSDEPRGFGLTPREVEVLRLLGMRQTDREIAAALFISPKTAGNHVTSILAKLGATNRREAAELAARLGFGRGDPDAL